jgi:hypothetical protein
MSTPSIADTLAQIDVLSRLATAEARVDALNREVNRLRIALDALYRQVNFLATMSGYGGAIPADSVHAFCQVAAKGAFDALHRRRP